MVKPKAVTRGARAIRGYLQYLDRKYPRAESLPQNAREFTMSLFGVRTVTADTCLLDILETTGSEELYEWAMDCKNTRPGATRARIKNQLKQMQVLEMQNGDIKSWNYERMQYILRNTKSNTRAASVGASSAFGIGQLQTVSRFSVLKPAAQKPIHRAATFQFITTHEQMLQLSEHNTSMFSPISMDTNENSKIHSVLITCKGTPERLHLVGLCGDNTPGITSKLYIFDCVKLGEADVCTFLSDLLANEITVKVIHDARFAAAAMTRNNMIIKPIVDTQLAVEAITSKFDSTLENTRSRIDESTSAHTSSVWAAAWDTAPTVNRTSQRPTKPLPTDMLQRIAAENEIIRQVYDLAKLHLKDSALQEVRRASGMRADFAMRNRGLRRMCFDSANGYRMRSFELLHVQRPDDLMPPQPLHIYNEVGSLLDLLEVDLVDSLKDRTEHVSDIVLDDGRQPLAWIDGKRVLLGNGENRLVTCEEIFAVVDRLGGFGMDNRAGLEGHLHRISAVRNRYEEITGLTLRVGRHIAGNATMIMDLLFGHAPNETPPSILFLGEPGSGKTTVIREITRILAEQTNVCIVDTSNEIAGDGNIPHPCVGLARRMMVPNLNQQSSVMVECVQNHTPHVMVIDEIGRSTEVDAASTCKNRSVRLIASAHGDLRKLVKNSKLRGLIGGIQNVILGDAQARVEAQRLGLDPSEPLSKMKAERAGAPIFDIIVELKRHEYDEWGIILDSSKAVDKILDGQSFEVQKRIRDPESGTIHVELAMCRGEKKKTI